MSYQSKNRSSRTATATPIVSGKDIPITALIAVDVQSDFLPGGALAVPNGHEVIHPLTKIADQVGLVVATRDYHPADHCSFQEQGGIWPVHCVAPSGQATTMDEAMRPHGSDLNPRIGKCADIVISKATTRDSEAYSGFDDTGLEEMLRERGITRVIVGGLATDYCVKATAIDAAKAGFETIVVKGACRAVNAEPEDEQRAYAEMTTEGVRLYESV
jgi:nicotinamidase/pyrazinamidase